MACNPSSSEVIQSTSLADVDCEVNFEHLKEQLRTLNGSGERKVSKQVE